MNKMYLWVGLGVVLCLMLVGIVVTTVFAMDWDTSQRWPAGVRTYQPTYYKAYTMYDTTTRGEIAPIQETKEQAIIRQQVQDEMKALGE